MEEDDIVYSDDGYKVTSNDLSSIIFYDDKIIFTLTYPITTQVGKSMVEMIRNSFMKGFEYATF